jgi:RNA recognition motif-containing protein
MTLLYRGFGFVTFDNDKAVQDVLAVAPHVIDGKTVDPKRATAKGSAVQQPHVQSYQSVQPQHPPGPNIYGGKKIFVGGLLNDTTKEDVQSYFGEYGVSEWSL